MLTDLRLICSTNAECESVLPASLCNSAKNPSTFTPSNLIHKIVALNLIFYAFHMTNSCGLTLVISF